MQPLRHGAPADPPAEQPGEVVAAPHEAVPDVVLGQRVANRPQLGAALVVVAADEAGAVEEDDEDADPAPPQEASARTHSRSVEPVTMHSVMPRRSCGIVASTTSASGWEPSAWTLASRCRIFCSTRVPRSGVRMC